MTEHLFSSAADHLVPHVCFHCRKVFKHAFQADAAQVGSAGLQVLSQAVCPECGALMHGAIRDFHAPKQNDLAKWRKAAEEYRQYLAQVLPEDDNSDPPAEPFFVARKHRAQAEVKIK